MKRVFLYLSLLALTLLGSCPKADAQRLIPHQKGLSLTVGTTALDHGGNGIFESGAYELDLSFSQYLKRFNYYMVGATYLQRDYKYQDYSTPVRTYLAYTGYAHPLLYDYTKTFLLYGAVLGVGGYQYLKAEDSTFPNGALLLDRSRFVYGVATQLSMELFITNGLILQLKGRGLFLWGTDLQLFYPSLSAGLKYNF